MASHLGRAVFLAATLLSIQSGYADPSPALNYAEIREVIRSNLVGVTDAELDQGALNGLLQSLRGRVSVIETQTNPSPTRTLSQIKQITEGIAYLRIEKIGEGLATQIASAVETLDRTNKLSGLIFDLRFAGGLSYTDTVAVADLFLEEEKDLLDAGSGVLKSSAKTNALELPVTLLVNGETVGAAETLAEVMRATGTGLILGSPTRGAAMTSREFTLKSGRKIRIADAPVKLGDGSTISNRGVQPDILVTVNEADERRYMGDPFATISKPSVTTLSSISATNRTVKRTRISEADLVRARREGLKLDEEELSPPEMETESPVIQDPALARAVDLLKGLAVVRRNRS